MLVVEMANGRKLDPSELSWGTTLRGIHYKASHFIGQSRLCRFFHSYGGHLVIMLIIIIFVVLGTAYITSPAFGAENQTASAGTANSQKEDAGTGTDKNVTPNVTPSLLQAGSVLGSAGNVTPGGTSNIPEGESNQGKTGTLGMTIGPLEGITTRNTALETIPVSSSTTTTPISPGTTGVPETPASQASGNWTLGNVTAFTATGIKTTGSLVTSESIAAIVLLFTLGFLIFTDSKSSKQIVVGKFDNYIGEEAGTTTDPNDKFINGVSTLLNGELHRLQQLYADVDNRRPLPSIGGRKGPLEYAITAGDDSGDKFKDIISSGTTVKIGGLVDVPIGSIAGILSKIFAGPQMYGGFHKDGDLIILNAFLSGPDSRSWRVEGKITTETFLPDKRGVQNLLIPGEDRSVRIVYHEKDKKLENLEAMVRELAYRIFTDLTTGGTVRWRATYAFSEGLRDYRSCLLSQKDKLRNLKNAEGRFREAISEDSTYGEAWYNLGVVYNELGNRDASDKAFIKAIEIKPDQWQAYYGLALNRFNRMLKDGMLKDGKYIGCDKNQVPDETLVREVLHVCDRAISLNPDYPNLDNLKGVCYRMLAIQKKGDEKNPGESDALFRQAADSHASAVKKAWRQLCSSQYEPIDDTVTRNSDIRKDTAIALWDLARTYYAFALCGTGTGLEGGKNATVIGDSLLPIESVLRQGIKIDPANTALSTKFTWYQKLRQALKIDPSKADLSTNAALYRSLGNVRYAMGRYQDASDAFESASKIDPTNVRYWLLLAMASERAADVKRRDFAIGKVLKMPTALKGLPDSWKTRITILPWDGKSRDLRILFNFQQTCIQSSSPAIPVDSIKGKEEILNRVKKPPLSSDIAWSGEWIEDPPWLNMAKGSYLAYSLANYLADQADQQTDDDPERMYQDEAEWMFQVALEFLSDEPLDSVWARWVRGTIHRKLAGYADKPMPELKKSLDWFKATPSLEIEHQKIRLDCIRSLIDQGEDKAYAALGVASKAVHMNPVGFDELVAHGDCLCNTGEVRQSISAYESALLMEPYDVNTLMALGENYRFLGLHCEKREEKEQYWKQAIRYYEDAREARKRILFDKSTEDKSRHVTANDDGAFWLKADGTLLTIYKNLGNLYLEMSDYGKSVAYYGVTLNLSLHDSDYLEETAPSALQYAEALLHKRDHDTCELYLSWLIETFEKLPLGQSPRPETEPLLSEEILLVPVEGTFGTAYKGEFYVRALLLQAYSLAERDAGLDNALGWIDKAEGVTEWMESKVKDEVFLNRKLETAGLTPLSDPDKEKLVKSFLSKKIPALKAEINDRRGWVYFKKGDLEKAKEKILDALALKADAGYNFHLAMIYATQYWEDKKEVDGRWATAYCEHALNMVPRRGLWEKATELKEKLSKQMSGQQTEKQSNQQTTPERAKGPLSQNQTGYGPPSSNQG